MKHETQILSPISLIRLIVLIILPILILPACPERRDMAEFLTEQGKTQMEAGELDAAKANFTYAIKLDSEYAEAYYLRGEVEFRKENFVAAAGDFHAAANFYELPKDKADAYSSESDSYYQLSNRKEALKIAELAIKTDPDCDFCYFRKGIVLLDIGDLKGAIINFDKCLKIDPDINESLIFRATTHIRMGKYRKALKDIEKSENNYENDKEKIYWIYILKSQAYYELGDVKKAENLLKEANEKYPDDPHIFLGLGYIEWARGNIDSSRDLFNKAIWTNKDCPEAYVSRCVVEYLKEDYSTSYDDCNRGKIAYGAKTGSGFAMMMSWVVQKARGKDKQAANAVKDFLSEGNPVGWRIPILKYAAGQFNEKELLDEVNKLEVGKELSICEAYFFLAQSKMIEDKKAAKSYLRKTMK